MKKRTEDEVLVKVFDLREFFNMINPKQNELKTDKEEIVLDESVNDKNLTEKNHIGEPQKSDVGIEAASDKFQTNEIERKYSLSQNGLQGFFEVLSQFVEKGHDPIGLEFQLNVTKELLGCKGIARFRKCAIFPIKRIKQKNASLNDIAGGVKITSELTIKKLITSNSGATVSEERTIITKSRLNEEDMEIFLDGWTQTGTLVKYEKMRIKLNSNENGIVMDLDLLPWGETFLEIETPSNEKSQEWHDKLNIGTQMVAESYRSIAKKIKSNGCFESADIIDKVLNFIFEQTKKPNN